MLFCAICTADLKTRRSKKRPVADAVCLFDSDPRQLWHGQMCGDKSDKSAFVTVCVGMKHKFKHRLQTAAKNSQTGAKNKPKTQRIANIILP